MKKTEKWKGSLHKLRKILRVPDLFQTYPYLLTTYPRQENRKPMQIHDSDVCTIKEDNKRSD